MQSPYIAAALSHARAQEFERTLRTPGRMARHELELERRSRRADRPSGWSRLVARLTPAGSPRASALKEPLTTGWPVSGPQHEANT